MRLVAIGGSDACTLPAALSPSASTSPATAIFSEMTIDALSDLDPSYPPPLGSPLGRPPGRRAGVEPAGTGSGPRQRPSTVKKSRLQGVRYWPGMPT